MSMDSLCTSPPSEMASPSDMVGHLRTHHHTALMDNHSVFLTYKIGGFPAVKHNKVRDITASLLTEVCHAVTIEPHLQSLSGETFSHRSAITEDGARLNVAMYRFGGGGRFEKAFVDVLVFNPSAQSNCNGPLSSVYRRHEQEKRRLYDQRVRGVERATFTPLVLSTTGGMERAATRDSHR